MAISNFFSGMKNLWLGAYDVYSDIIVPATITGSNKPFNIENADNISTVYTCIKILSDTISRLPLNVYTDFGEGRTVDKDDYRYPILHYNPNGYTSQQTFFAALEYWRNLKGNAFARIHRKTGKISALELLPPSTVTGYAVSNGELYYEITIDDKSEKVNSSEILHFRSTTKDGIWGISPITALRMNLSTSYQGMNAINSFYQNNALSPKAIKSTVSGTNQKAMIEALEEFNRKFAGTTNAGKIIPLPPNTDMVDMALNFADAEFISTMKFNAQQIAALYGVPPASVGILESTKFNNVESMMLDFKVTTLASIGRMYRQELESKLLSLEERIAGYSIEFNWDALLEVDSATRINNLKTLASLGVVSVNDIAKIEGWPSTELGEARLVPGNYLDLKDIVNKNNSVK